MDADGRVVLALVLAVIAVPFAVSGIVTTLALTRTHAPSAALRRRSDRRRDRLPGGRLAPRPHQSQHRGLRRGATGAVGAICFRRAAGSAPGWSSRGAAAGTGSGAERRRRTSARSLPQEPAGLDGAGPAQPVEQPRARPGARAAAGAGVLLGPRTGRRGVHEPAGVRAAGRRSRHPDDRVGRQPGVARLGVLRRDRAALPDPQGRDGGGHRRRRRPRRPGGDLEPEPVDHRRRDQQQHRRAARHAPSPLHPARRSSGRPAGARRGPRLHDPDERSLRRDPDVARRHLGGHRRRSLHAERERALHPGSVAHLPGSPDAHRRAERVALVLAAAGLGNEPADGAGRRRAARARRGPAARPPGAGRASQRGHAAGVGGAAVRGRPAHPGSHQRGARLHHSRLAAAARVRSAAECDRAAASRWRNWRRPPPTISTTTGRPPTRGRSSSTWCGPRPGGAPAP